MIEGGWLETGENFRDVRGACSQLPKQRQKSKGKFQAKRGREKNAR